MICSVLSFDLGTANTGFTLLKANRGESDKLCHPALIYIADCGMIKTKKLEGGSSEVRERIDEIGKEFLKLVRDYAPTYIAIEDFTEQGKIVGKTYKEMSWLTEHFRLLGRTFAQDVSVYENGDWKKILMGASRLTKAQVQHCVRHKIMNSEVLDKFPDHVWDAAGIGLAKLKTVMEPPPEPIRRV